MKDKVEILYNYLDVEEIRHKAESENEEHIINCEIVENEYYISINHDMTREHYISFISYVTNDRCEIVKLYPEQNAEARFLKRGKGIIYAYCNKDGLVKKEINNNIPQSVQ